MPAEIIANKLHLDGYIYLRTRERNGKTYWECRPTRMGNCSARAVTIIRSSDDQLEVTRGPQESEHSHPPKRKESASEKLVAGLKSKAEEHSDQRPAQICLPPEIHWMTSLPYLRDIRSLWKYWNWHFWKIRIVSYTPFTTIRTSFWISLILSPRKRSIKCLGVRSL